MHASYSEIQLDHGNLKGKRVRRYRRIQPAKAGLVGGMILPFGRLSASQNDCLRRRLRMRWTSERRAKGQAITMRLATTRVMTDVRETDL